MNIGELTNRLDTELRTEAFAEIDGSPNGLQVEPDGSIIERVALTVDTAAATIRAAREWDADLLVAHHGLWWKGTDRLTGFTADRVRALLKNDIGLYVSHLPLDAHPTLGNAAGVADKLELSDRAPFGDYDGERIGQRGQLNKQTDLETLANILEEDLDGTKSVRTLTFGPQPITDVAIVTGRGGDYVHEATNTDVDVLVTGEATHERYHEARELNMNLILAGHYATETTGVKAIGEQLDTWGLETTFLSHPTGF